MKNPLITMSAVTGKPNKTGIYEYLKGLKEIGIEQAMLYPRSGCEIEYLSEKWFEVIGSFIDTAKELDMCLWLYDDFNWPSGDAGGRVTAHEQFRLKAIETRGEMAGEISYKSRHNAGLFGEKFFPNLLCSEAVDFFIKTTHEEYYRRFGKYFGSVIKGIFTDEPSIGYCCEGTSVSYYDGMENDYCELYKRDFLDDMKSEYNCFYENVVALISKRFRESYINRLADWCKSHGILMTGHFMCDDDPAGAIKHSGDFLDNLSGISLPGVDEIYTDFKSRNEMALLGSIEYARNKNGAMAELFALGPCSMSYAKKCAMLYLCAMFKIDHYFLAVSHMDMRGNRLITDYFNNFNKDQPDFGGTRLLAKEAEKASLFAKMDFTPDVYVRYPFAECAKNITGWYDTTAFHTLLNELTYNQIQWKLINHEIDLNAPIIEMNEEGRFLLNGEPFNISKIRHKTVVTDQNLHTPSGIFVRRYDDGSFVAINLFAPKGVYLVNGKSVYFDEYSIVTSCETKEYRREEIKEAFDVQYKNNNIIRTMHLSDESDAEIQCENETEVVLAVREDACAYLNGEKISCEGKADCLSAGMRNLYKISSPVSIKQGKSIATAKNDFKYLPSLLLIGNFACESNGNMLFLKQRKKHYKVGDRVCDFGTVELVTKIIVPNGASAIELMGTELYTKLYVDNELVGERIAAPYFYSISPSLWGKNVELKIVQHTSIAPIFGDVKYWDDLSERVGWRGTPSTQKQRIGFDKIRWCF